MTLKRTSGHEHQAVAGEAPPTPTPPEQQGGLATLKRGRPGANGQHRPELRHPADLMHLQRTMGNQATARLLRPPSQPEHSLPWARLQRTIDMSTVMDAPLLTQAIGLFHELEQSDLTPEEFAQLKQEVSGQRQRFMPLLGRFATARATTLRVTKDTTQRRTGDMAVTELFAITNDDRMYEYDKHQDTVLNHVRQKTIKGFRVEIAFWARRVLGEAIPNSLKTVGTLLQAFTHEMTVHAENMLDFIEDYWGFVDGQGGPPGGLPSASAEHAVFKEERVARYQYMRGRALQQGGELAKDYDNREFNDKLTAK